MKNQRSRYIGIDIAAKSFDAYFPGKSENHLFESFSNDREGWLHLCGLIDDENDIVVIEATGSYHLGLAVFLHGKEKNVCVVNPLSVKHFSRMKMQRAKTDRMDSLILSQFGEMMQPDFWSPKERHLTDLQQLMTLSEQLVKQRTALKNQLGSFKLVPLPNEFAIGILEGQITALTGKLKEIEKRIDEIIEHSYSQLNQSLTSIPGIGKKTAATLVLITEGFTKFETYRALIAYAGLAPRTFESGTSVRGASHICKLGARQLRKLLYECAHSAKRFNPACKKLFDRLYHERKKPFKVAMIAVANKLIKIAFALAISGNEFDPKYLEAK